MRGVLLALCGDVMTGRAIDQILPHPGDPELNERYVGSSLHYVDLAQARNGEIRKPVEFSYVWGDALEYMRRCDARIINLETGITAKGRAWPKGVHYRMSPANAGCISAADIDCCALANNHVMDYGEAGLRETLDTLHRTNLPFAGAGRDETEAAAPVMLDVPDGGRVIVFSYGSPSSGIPPEWAARPERPGVNWLAELTTRSADRIAKHVAAVKHGGDIAVVSIHWDVNFGYYVPADEIEFAHALIDSGAVDVVHGHSSHHAKAVDIYRRKLILYGCGDFLNDYEGIPGYEEFRGDLVLLYELALNPVDGTIERLSMRPFKIVRFRLRTAECADVRWLCEVLNRESVRFAVSFAVTDAGNIEAAL